MTQPDDVEILLPSFFSGNLSQEEAQIVEDWKNTSEKNRLIFINAENVWKGLELLQEMRTYDTSRALMKVNAAIPRAQAHQGSSASGKAPAESELYFSQIGRSQKSGRRGKTRDLLQQDETPNPIPEHRAKGILFYWQRIAAILLLPVILLSIAYYFFNDTADGDTAAWQTIFTPPGIKSQTQLPDGTKVWLNSDSRLSYPIAFKNDKRQVKLEGEAFFEVVKNTRRPFYVDLGRIGIEVTGTKFNAINYKEEKQTEVILASGKINLLDQQGNQIRVVTAMKPGEKAIFREASGKIAVQNVDTEKYTSWIHGRLIFRDDSMTEVVRRLSRWFNVEIDIADPAIAQYVYTATFGEETIEQILDLFKRTSPIQYAIVPAPRKDDGSFVKQRIILNPR